MRISICKVTVRVSPGRTAPTPTTRLLIISPCESRTSTSTEYSQAVSVPGWWITPSMRRGYIEGAVGRACAAASKRRRRWHDGQLTALRRINSPQWGHFHVSPTGPMDLYRFGGWPLSIGGAASSSSPSFHPNSTLPRIFDPATTVRLPAFRSPTRVPESLISTRELATIWPRT